MTEDEIIERAAVSIVSEFGRLGLGRAPYREVATLEEALTRDGDVIDVVWRPDDMRAIARAVLEEVRSTEGTVPIRVLDLSQRKDDAK